MEKMTKRDYFKELKEIVADRTDLIEFIDHELELLDRKKSSNTESKTQIENKAIKDKIVNALINVAKAVTITELQELNSEMATYSNQKLSALLKQLVETNQVEKIVDKKKSYFKAI